MIACHVGSLVVRASDSRPEGLGLMPPNTLRVHTDFHVEIVEVEIGGVVIYRPFGEFRRAKSYCHLQINLEVDSDCVQELQDSRNQELTIDELIEMHEQEQDIEELESLDLIQSEDRMMVENLTDVSLFEKGLQI
ncbi:hypothetical protein TNCV_3493611 [Trichonephila clavipes]|nr:hypothetical protein TNCV_3493611 [Trichonephila clavipes]